ncbi:hypothetical protein PENSPDRAFT_689087 [Peniophora sp. CONT]|nr:hypothetical protein PENSPDRAFT_689087 [Peniophora sp. CONT]
MPRSELLRHLPDTSRRREGMLPRGHPYRYLVPLEADKRTPVSAWDGVPFDYRSQMAGFHWVGCAFRDKVDVCKSAVWPAGRSSVHSAISKHMAEYHHLPVRARKFRPQLAPVAPPRNADDQPVHAAAYSTAVHASHDIYSLDGLISEFERALVLQNDDDVVMSESESAPIDTAADDCVDPANYDTRTLLANLNAKVAYHLKAGGMPEDLGELPEMRDLLAYIACQKAKASSL